MRLKEERRVGDFVFGDTPTLADVCLVPQVWNAQRFDIPLDSYPTIKRIADNAMALEALKQAEPANQPDAKG
jgi:maleylpyruvate isomerase